VEAQPVVMRSTPEVVAPQAAPQPPQPPAEEPEVPRNLRKKTGILGAEIRFIWGRQNVGEFFVKPGKRNFLVGTAEGVNFVLDDPKVGPKFELLKADESGFTARFTGKLKGELIRGDQRLDLTQLIESGKVVQDDGAYALSLGKQDILVLNMGGLRVELTLEPVPKPVWVPWQESVDFATLNIFLVIFFLSALFVISAINRDAAGDQWVDELNADSRIVKLVIKPPEQLKNNPLLDELAKHKEKAKAAERMKGNEGTAGTKESKDTNKKMAPKQIRPDSKDQARQIMARLMGGGRNGGLSTLLGNGMGGELRAMLGGLQGKVAGDSNGFGGLGLKGSQSGGGALGNTIGIAGVGTRFGGDREGAARSGSHIMGDKKKTDIAIQQSDMQIQGSIDPELIRRVIHSHRDQIRYCYEMELVRQPKLAGKVKIRFVIGENGFVTSTGVAESSVHNPTLEQCIAARVKSWEFPKPKGGGVAIVSYPFVFKQSGE
jgi:TonB family protein